MKHRPLGELMNKNEIMELIKQVEEIFSKVDKHPDTDKLCEIQNMIGSLHAVLYNIHNRE